MGLAGLPDIARASKKTLLPRLSRSKARAEFERVFRLITAGDFGALQAYGPIQLVVGQKTLTEEESRAFVADFAAAAATSGARFLRISSFDRAKGDSSSVMFYASLEYRLRVENYCYPQDGDGGMPPFCTNEPGYQFSIAGWFVMFEGPLIKRLQETSRIA